jgi:hypothetical protein
MGRRGASVRCIPSNSGRSRMRRPRFVAAVAALAVLAASVSATTAVAKTRHRVALTLVGARIGPTELVYEVHGTSRGALVQLTKSNATATGGTSTSTFYDGQGTTAERDAYTASPPDASGIITISGSGRFVSGTGKDKGITGTYKFTGSFNRADHGHQPEAGRHRDLLETPRRPVHGVVPHHDDMPVGFTRGRVRGRPCDGPGGPGTTTTRRRCASDPGRVEGRQRRWRPIHAVGPWVFSTPV